MNNQVKVQKSNKKTKLNGFSLYAIEYNGRKVVEGESPYVTAREIEGAKPSWNRLLVDQRQAYNDRAKQLNMKIIHTQVRYNSLGQNLVDVETERNKAEEEKRRRQEKIKSLIKNAADVGELDNKVFYFVSVSIFYDDIDDIYPAELAMSKFSLRQGVFDSMSLEINPGDLPIGSAYNAQRIAETTHKYPLPPDFFGEKDYTNVMFTILNFLDDDEELPIFFTEGFEDSPTDSKKLKDTHRVLKLIFEKVQEYQLASELKVYSVIELFYYLVEISTEIRNELDPNYREVSFVNFTDAYSKFKSSLSEFVYTANICDYHHGVEVVEECCLNKSLCFGYVISKWCSQVFKYQLKPGFHFPKNHILQS